MLTFLGFLACTLFFAAALWVAALPLVNRLLRWCTLRAVRKAARRIGRAEVLAAIERQRTTPGLSCAVPDPVLGELQTAAARRTEKLAPLMPALPIVFLAAGAALSAWVFYL